MNKHRSSCALKVRYRTDRLGVFYFREARRSAGRVPEARATLHGRADAEELVSGTAQTRTQAESKLASGGRPPCGPIFEELIMLRQVTTLNGSAVDASDGTIGHVEDTYFDDEGWAIRYLVVATGSWLTGREVLISPHAVKAPLGDDAVVKVSMTREQVRKSPDIDTHKPVSRQHEFEYYDYYGYGDYWYGGDLWGISAYPMAASHGRSSDDIRSDAERWRGQSEATSQDVHLRSTKHVSGYHIQATDEGIGHVEDFIFDDSSWAIRYLVVDTRNWWPGGKTVLVGTRWIDRIDWVQRKVFTSLSREAVKTSPEYQVAVGIDRDYEKRLHAAYGREGYWDYRNADAPEVRESR